MILNNITNNRHRVYILLYPEISNVYNNVLTNEQCKIYLPYNISLSKPNKTKRDLYIFDCRAFAEKIARITPGQKYIPDNQFTHLLPVVSIDTEPQNIYRQISSYIPFNLLSMPDPFQEEINGSLNTGIILPHNQQNIFGKGLQALWKISVFPFVPFQIFNTVPNSRFAGPCFMTNFTINITETNDVSISMGFKGSQTIVSEIFDPIQYKTEDLRSIPSSTDPLYDGEENHYAYRTSKFYDCAITNHRNITLLELINSHIAKTFRDITIDKIIEIKLSITQDVQPTYTFSKGKKSKNRLGAKFYALKDHLVTGEITVLSNSRTLPFLGELFDLKIYFGGPFVYPIHKVDFQSPSFSIQADNGGYIIKIPFIASLGGNTKYLPQNNDDYCSEFAVKSSILFNTMNTIVYTQ